MRIFLSLLLIASLAGCLYSTEESRMKPKTINGLELALKANKASYTPGEPVTLELTVTNKSKEAFRETFRSAQIYDFVAKKEESEVWRWSHDRMFAMMLTEYVLEPQESVIYKVIWNQKDSDGNSIPSGKYNLVGILKTLPEKQSFPIVIEIKD